MSECEPIRPDELDALFARWVPRPDLACALAVSGGSDSTALMVLFADWLRQSGRTTGLHTVLTVDHRLRAESKVEAHFVAEQAATFGFRHATLVWADPNPQTGIQAAARHARYRLIGAYMQSNGIALLLTGHTRDDQAETLLMRLARGSGLDGLAGMSPRLRFSQLGSGLPAQPDPEIVRPLLEVPNSRLRATLTSRGIPWLEDPSNRSLDFERPRLRAARAGLEALGLTASMLALSATRLLRARRALEAAVDRFCGEDGGAVSVDARGVVTIDRRRLQAAEEEIALRTLARAVAAAGGRGAQISLRRLESIAASVRDPEIESAGWTLARAMITATRGNVTVERERGREPPAELTLEPGASAGWDGRFWVGNRTGADTVKVGALGEEEARELRRQGVVAADVSPRVASLVPAFRCVGKLVAVPSLGFWILPHGPETLEARFAGMETVKGKPNSAPQGD
jgi:tRNA(Ile)-lysidine synthase